MSERLRFYLVERRLVKILFAAACATLLSMASPVFAQDGATETAGESPFPQEFQNAMIANGMSNTLQLFNAHLIKTDINGGILSGRLKTIEFIRKQAEGSAIRLDLLKDTFGRDFHYVFLNYYAYSLLRKQLSQGLTLALESDFSFEEKKVKKISGLTYRLDNEKLIITRALRVASVAQDFSIEEVYVFFDAVKAQGLKLRLPLTPYFRLFTPENIFIVGTNNGDPKPISAVSRGDIAPITLVAGAPPENWQPTVAFFPIPLNMATFRNVEHDYFRNLIKAQGRSVQERSPPRQSRVNLSEVDFKAQLNAWFLSNNKAWPRSATNDLSEANLAWNVKQRGGQATVFIHHLSEKGKRAALLAGCLPATNPLLDFIAKDTPENPAALLSLAILVVRAWNEKSDIHPITEISKRNDLWSTVLDNLLFQRMVQDLEASACGSAFKL